MLSYRRETALQGGLIMAKSGSCNASPTLRRKKTATRRAQAADCWAICEVDNEIGCADWNCRRTCSLDCCNNDTIALYTAESRRAETGRTVNNRDQRGVMDDYNVHGRVVDGGRAGLDRLYVTADCSGAGTLLPVSYELCHHAQLLSFPCRRRRSRNS